MALDVTAGGLMREVNAWRTKTAGWRGQVKKTLDEYETPAASGEVDTTQPENFKYRYTLHTTARNMSGRPYVRLESKNPIGEGRIADLTDSGNAWICSTHYDELRQHMIADQCLADESITLITQRARLGFEENDDPPKTPAATLISLEMYMCDVYATNKRTARLEGHCVIVDRDELLTQAHEENKKGDEHGGWIVENIAKLITDGVAKTYRTSADQDVPRSEVVYWEIWVPGHRHESVDPNDKHYHGTVFCVAVDQEPMMIRHPRPYFGPREGPYALGGTMVVPRKPRYISNLTAAEGLIQKYNAQSRANDIAARNRKCVAGVDAMVAGLNPAIVSAFDGDIVPIPGLSQNPNSVQKIETGGITVEARQRELELKIAVERELALSDALQGSVTGAGTATENLIAAKAGANVASLIDGGIENADIEVIRRVLWYLDNDYRSMVSKDGEVYLGGNTYEDKKKALQHAVANGVLEPEQAKESLDELEKQSGPMGTLDDLEVYVECVRADAAEESRMTVANNMLLQWSGPLLAGAGQFMPGLPKFFERAGRSLRVQELAKALDVPASAQFFQDQQDAANAPEARTAPAAAPPREVKSAQQQKPKPNTAPIKAAAKVGAA